jgi:Tfp pilus assembly protein PilX
MTRRPRGLSLAEVLLALLVVILLVLTLAAMSFSMLKSNKKSADRPVGFLAAQHILSREIYAVQNDNPPGSKVAFWGSNWTTTPWRSGQEVVNRTTFSYAIYAVTLQDVVSGAPLGNDPATGFVNNRVKKLDIQVDWSGDVDGTKGGAGRLSSSFTRLLHEGE